MTEYATSLASRPQEAKEVSGPSVSPDGMAVTVIIQLQAWNMVANYLSTTMGEPSAISRVYVLTPGAEPITWSTRRVLEDAPQKPTLWHTEPKAPSHSVKMLRDAILKQEQPIFYVFCTDESSWSQNPFWTEIIGEDLVEKGVVLGRPAGNNVVEALTSFDKTLPATNQAESHHTAASPASVSFHETHSMSAQGDSTPEHDTVDQLGEQPEIVAKISTCIGKQLNQSGRYRRFMTTGGTDDSESKEDNPTEFSPSPSVAPVEKATPAQKGDEFLSFLERALSIYEKV